MKEKNIKSIGTTELMSLIPSSSIARKVSVWLSRAQIVTSYLSEGLKGDGDVSDLLDHLYTDKNYDEVMSYLKENNLSALIVGDLLDSGYVPQEINSFAVIKRWIENSEWYCLNDLYSWYHELIQRELFLSPADKEGDC